MISFTFNGSTSTDKGLKVLAVRRWLLPAPNDSYIQISGRQGSLLYPRERQDGTIEIDCAVVDSTRQNLRIKARQITAWLSTKERSQLLISDEPDKYYMGKLSQEVPLESEPLFTEIGEFTLFFRCEPLALGEEVIAYFTDDSVAINNLGTASTELFFQSTFMVAAAEWKVALGTDYCRVIHAFQVGDVLTINFGTGAVLLNGARAMNLLDWQNSRFFTLPPGESTLTITPPGASAALVKYTPKWL
ncbi:MAG TPA: hypothetical protein DCZ10_16195 [Pelotomaculum sp.]|jgi:predicted phage tail component-like protein|uniref:Phage tail component n=1 Tax=Syntrophomonas wolfei TaxID=863 RepID=A0A354YX60_9FIRM|nr:hypothetical protein [Pelotomaculum sp.]HBK53940.1 hypothetical protein [Syntrophomonas wolfei]